MTKCIHKILVGGGVNYVKSNLHRSKISYQHRCNVMKCIREILVRGSTVSSQICIDLKYHLTQV